MCFNKKDEEEIYSIFLLSDYYFFPSLKYLVLFLRIESKIIRHYYDASKEIMDAKI